VRWHWITGPAALAAVVTLANAAKPVVVDDAAYLAFARHVARHPLDPYGFDIFWYDAPEPAMGVLCPPVVPYWLGLGIRVFGEHIVALKLWLFPFVWLLAWSLHALLRRFARGTERTALPLLMLSPAVLPTVNLMLDIPAAALGLAALVLFIRASGRRSWWLAVLAGIVAALAVQSKYTALLLPPLLGWYGLTHRRMRFAVVAVGLSVVAFAGWEFLLLEKYGRSHFLVHLSGQSTPAEPGVSWLTALARQKAPLVPALAAHLGCLAVGVALFAGRAVGLSRTTLLIAAGVWAVGVVLVATLPHHDTVLVYGNAPGQAKLTLAALVWRTAGAGVLLAAVSCARLLLARRRRERRRSADGAFVVGWVILELAGYFALTPFPAARRVIGLTLALGVLGARAVSRANRLDPRRRPPRWVVPFGVTVGILVAALDAFDAMPEKDLAERAAEVVRPRPPDWRVWYYGHGGFQFYCERAGMRPLVGGETAVAEGDYLVLPVYPDAPGYYRPQPGQGKYAPHLPADAVERVAEFTWDDPLSAQTNPTFYGGADPVVGRDFPRLRVTVYRATAAWVVPPPVHRQKPAPRR